jgi:hypothetical protein
MTTDRNSSRSSNRVVVAATLAMLACVPLLAHRRDEYLQAARIAVDPARVGIELDITAGIALAPAVMAEIDRNRDGSIDESEAKAYALDVQSGLRLEIDGRALRVELIDVRAPQPVSLAGGEGPIRITLAAALPALGPGHHRVFYRNDHHPADAAYLANALAPSSPRVEIGPQRRDADQRELTIEYTLDGREAAGASWLLVAGLAAELTTIGGLGLLFGRWRRT